MAVVIADNREVHTDTDKDTDFMTDNTFALDNAYQAPQAALEDASNSDCSSLYVVSVKKLVILCTLTLGLYSLYWFYSNYARIKETTGERIWPAPRAVFQIFFTYNLFNRIDQLARSQNIAVSWSHRSLAAAYITIVLIQNNADKVSEVVGAIALLTIPIMAFILAQIQPTINAINGDINAETNNRFTWANYTWCALGSLLWFILLLDAADIFGLINLN